MKVSSYALARPNYYDRGVTHTGLGFAGSGVTPHGDTVRGSVTVAAGKKGFLDMGTVGFIRTTAATTVGLSYAYLGIQPGGGTQQILQLVPMYNITVGTTVFQSVAGQLAFVASDVLQIGTGDASIGGQFQFLVYSHMTLFDA